MAEQSKSALNIQADFLLPDNTSKQISPADVRKTIKDLNDSTWNKVDDSNLDDKYTRQEVDDLIAAIPTHTQNTDLGTSNSSFYIGLTRQRVRIVDKLGDEIVINGDFSDLTGNIVVGWKYRDGQDIPSSEVTSGQLSVNYTGTNYKGPDIACDPAKYYRVTFDKVGESILYVHKVVDDVLTSWETVSTEGAITLDITGFDRILFQGSSDDYIDNVSVKELYGDVEVSVNSGASWTALDYQINNIITSWKWLWEIPAVRTTAFTLALADSGNLLRVSSELNVNVTVPSNSTVPFPVGTRIKLIQSSTGTVTIVAGNGVTINSASGLVLNAQFAEGDLVKIDADAWMFTQSSGGFWAWVVNQTAQIPGLWRFTNGLEALTVKIKNTTSSYFTALSVAVNGILRIADDVGFTGINLMKPLTNLQGADTTSEHIVTHVNGTLQSLGLKIGEGAVSPTVADANGVALSDYTKWGINSAPWQECSRQGNKGASLIWMDVNTKKWWEFRCMEENVWWRRPIIESISLYGITNSALQTEMFVNGVANERVTLVNNSVFVANLKIVGLRTDGASSYSASYHIHVQRLNNAFTFTQKELITEAGGGDISIFLSSSGSAFSLFLSTTDTAEIKWTLEFFNIVRASL